MQNQNHNATRSAIETLRDMVAAFDQCSVRYYERRAASRQARP